MRTLILYVFHEECDNLRLFIERGLFDAWDKEFIFIYNDASFKFENDSKLPPSLKGEWDFLFTRKNVHLLVRPNVGQDFQGWNTALFLPSDSLEHVIIYEHKYQNTKVGAIFDCFDKFIFINSTVAGPYLPSYVNSNWVDCFTSKLSSEVKIVGVSANFMMTTRNSSINELIYKNYGIIFDDPTHIQSMIFGLNKSGLDILIRYGLFSPGKVFPLNKHLIVITCEIAMSMIFRIEGYSMFSYMISQGLIPASRRDPTDNYWNHPIPFPMCELMFVKTMPYISFPEKYRYDTLKL